MSQSVLAESVLCLGSALQQPVEAVSFRAYLNMETHDGWKWERAGLTHIMQWGPGSLSYEGPLNEAFVSCLTNGC